MTDWTPPPPGPPAPPGPPTPFSPPPGWTGTDPGSGAYEQGRPRAIAGGALLLLSAGLLVLGTLLPWVTAYGASMNGLDNFSCAAGECIATDSTFERAGRRADVFEARQPGRATLLAAVSLGAFGLVLVTAGRVMTVAVFTLVCTSLGLVVSAGLYVVVTRLMAAGDFRGDLGSGPAVVVLSAVVGVVGSITALVQRTPRQAPVPTPAIDGG